MKIPSIDPTTNEKSSLLSSQSSPKTTPRHKNHSSSHKNSKKKGNNLSFPISLSSSSVVTTKNLDNEYQRLDNNDIDYHNTNNINSNSHNNNQDTTTNIRNNNDGINTTNSVTTDINIYPPNFNNIAIGGGLGEVGIEMNDVFVESTLMATSNTFTTDESDDIDDHNNDDDGLKSGLGRLDGHSNQNHDCIVDNVEIDEYGNIIQDRNGIFKQQKSHQESNNEDDDYIALSLMKNKTNESNTAASTTSSKFRPSHDRQRLYSNDLLLKNSSSEYDLEYNDTSAEAHSLNSKVTFSNSIDTSLDLAINGHHLHHQDSHFSSNMSENQHHRQSSKTGVIGSSSSRRKFKKHKGPMEQFIQCFCQRFCWFCPTMPRPSWSRVSSAVVRYAPCFFCAGKLETSATDRMLLMRLNVLCAFFSLCQFGVGVFIMIVFLSDLVVDRGVEYGGDFVNEALTPNLW